MDWLEKFNRIVNDTYYNRDYRNFDMLYSDNTSKDVVIQSKIDEIYKRYRRFRFATWHYTVPLDELSMNDAEIEDQLGFLITMQRFLKIMGLSENAMVFSLIDMMISYFNGTSINREPLHPPYK